jgi:serine/threonine protein phosphatase PrpC
MTLRLVVGSATDVGQVRDHNEDAYLVDDGLGLVAVADGMGGHRGGEVASATAIDALKTTFAESRDLRAAVRAANSAVLERAEGDDALRGMGTTLTTAALATDGGLIVGHVGDSRAYLLRDGELRRVTEDHSLVEELIRAGELTEEEAERDPRRSMITRAIGLEPDVDVDLIPIDLRAGDRVLICSDGLTGMVREEAVAEALTSETDPAAAARVLVDAANAAGGVDNTTVVVIDAVADDTETQPIPPTDATMIDDESDVDDESGADGEADAAAPRGRRRFLLFGRRK